MTERIDAFISFEKKVDKFIGYVSINALYIDNRNLQKTIKSAESIYSSFVLDVKKTILKIERAKKQDKEIIVRDIWNIGDSIFNLTERIEKSGLQLDRIYDHLSRDLGKGRSWFKKAITLRRYIKSADIIPKSAKWKDFKKSIKEKALEISPPKK